MDIVSKGLGKESSLLKKILLATVSVIFFYISIPAYLIYQSGNGKNSKDFRKKLRISLITTALYLPIFFIFIMLSGFTQDGTGEGYTVGVSVAAWTLVFYSFLHIIFLMTGAIKKQTGILKILVWTPLIILVLSLIAAFLG